MAWRFNTLKADILTIKEYPDQYKSYTLPEDTAFFAVRKKDRLPAYQLSSVIDDLHFGVDLVIRGTDLFGSTLAQQLVAESLGDKTFKEVTFLQHKLLKGPKKKKLSKSEGSTSIQFLRKEGKKPSDIYRIFGELSGLKEPIVDFESFRANLGFT